MADSTQSSSTPSGSPFARLKPLAGRALELALNRAVALDPDTRDALDALDGRRITLTLESPPLALEVRVAQGRLHVGPVDAANEPDLAVRSSIAGLLSQLPGMGGSRRGAPVTGRMRIAGDADLARRLQSLATAFDPDWQKPFTTVFGDLLGVQIANACAGALRETRVLASNLAESAAEYVTEESRDVVARDELAAFNDDVDAIRDDVERLSVRATTLRERLGKPSPGRSA